MLKKIIFVFLLCFCVSAQAKSLKTLTLKDIRSHNKILQLHYVENAITQKDFDLLNLRQITLSGSIDFTILVRYLIPFTRSKITYISMLFNKLASDYF